MPRPARPSRPDPDSPTAERPSSAWLFVAGLLLAARYLQPTEAAVFGETLWQAQLWLAAAAAWCAFGFRSGGATLRVSWLDGFVWLLVVGHAVSTVPVLVEGGDRRAAVNLVWEWAGLAAMVFLVRQVLPIGDERRTVRLFAGVVVALAALGVWQHHVGLPATAGRYDELRAIEGELAPRVATGDATAGERATLAEIRAELAGYGVPDDAAARRRWEDRVKFSTEPFGTFGLANTLGGLLAAAVPVLLGALARIASGSRERSSRRSVGVEPASDRAERRGGRSLQRQRWATAGLVASALVVLHCLVLTKSRTAWVGLAVGAVAAVGLSLLRGRVNRTGAYATVGVAAGSAVLAAVVFATGGLDRQVLSEAPKSLRYRLDYWSGALGVLSERPLLGTGPGNFRSYYLEHRPVGASEEIASPHNFFLDVWAAGGLVSLGAVVGLLGYVVVRMLRARVSRGLEDVPGDAGVEGPSLALRACEGRALEWGAMAAFPVVVAVYFLAGEGIDWRLLAIWPVAAAAMFCLVRSNGLVRSNERAAGVVGAGAAFVALAVHLLGADGIEFPAVAQTLLLLSIALDRPRESLARSRRGLAIAGVVFGVLMLGCLLTGLRPVLNGGAIMRRAEAMAASGDAAADRLLMEAAEADPLSMRPALLRAEIATAVAGSTESAATLETARRRWQEVLSADPRNLYARRRLAELLLDRDDAAEGSELANEAAELLREAVRLSPSDAELRFQLALALEAAGASEAAGDQAASALRLDDINRASGHTDLMFDSSRRSLLERLVVVGKAGERP